MATPQHTSHFASTVVAVPVFTDARDPRIGEVASAALKRIIVLSIEGAAEAVVAEGELADITDIWNRVKLPRLMQTTHNLVMWDRHAPVVAISYYTGNPMKDKRCTVCVDRENPKTIWKYSV